MNADPITALLFVVTIIMVVIIAFATPILTMVILAVAGLVIVVCAEPRANRNE